VGKNAINDPEKPFVTSGIRLGSPAMTTRGFRMRKRAGGELHRGRAGRQRGPGRRPVALCATHYGPRCAPPTEWGTSRVKCPFCSAEDTQVIDSRVSEEGDSIRRRRRCQVCNKRFTTYETAELRMPQIVKTDGVREDFSSAKLRTGFQRALHKRPVTTELVDAAIQRIEQKMLALGEREIDSRRLGEMVMEELRKLDKVAYIRFASVYKSFSDVDDFRDAIREVREK
jgi:transcriptional repressor NrdR